MNSSSFQLCSREHFQYLKGISILAILIGHIGNSSGKTWFTPLGGIGVAIFLFCSGYGLTKSYQKSGLQDFWKKKLLNIWLPFAIVEIVSGVILRRNILDIFLDLIFMKRLNPLGWYMQYLVVCYLLFWLGMKFIKNNKVRLSIWLSIAIISFFIFSNLRAEQAFSFFLGITVANIDVVLLCKRFEKKKFLTVGFLLEGLFVFLLVLKQMPMIRAQHHYFISAINLVMKLSCALGLMLITMYLHPVKKVISWIGSISYSLYLVHGYFMGIMENRFVRSFLLNFLANGIVMAVASFAVAALLHYTIAYLKQHKSKI